MSTSCVLLKITQVCCIRFHLGAGTSTVAGHKSFQKDPKKQEEKLRTIQTLYSMPPSFWRRLRRQSASNKRQHWAFGGGTKWRPRPLAYKVFKLLHLEHGFSNSTNRDSGFKIFKGTFPHPCPYLPMRGPICPMDTDHLQSSVLYFSQIFRFTLNIATITSICHSPGLAAFGSRQTGWIARLLMPAISGSSHIIRISSHRLFIRVSWDCTCHCTCELIL